MRPTLLPLILFAPIALAIPPKNHKPEISYLDNGTIKLGADLNLGGAITYLSRSSDDTNIINSWDWGRQIQMSYYSGPNPFTPNNKQPAPEWRALGWNPIQSGDHFGNPSKIIKHTNDGKSLYVQCIPMIWPLDNEPAECTFETWYTLEGPAVHVRARLNNNRSDKTQYSARNQELPAVYTNGPFYRLFTYTSDKPFTRDKLSQIDHPLGKNNTPWETWPATESWAALVNDDNFGIGVFHPGCYKISGGFAGKPGKGGPKDSPTGYISPNRAEILDHNIQHEYQYTLILGDLNSIRDYVYEHAKKPAPPNYVFKEDRQGCTYHHAKDTGWPIQNELHIQPTGQNATLITPESFWQASEAPTLYLRANFKTQNKEARIFWTRHNDRALKSMTFPITPDNQYHTYQIPLSQSADYQGIITSLRLELATTSNETDQIKIQSLTFQKPD
jgi:hypothetical protein